MSDEKRFTSREARIDAAAHHLLDRLPDSGFLGGLTELLVFGIKQAFACLFGGAMLALMIATKLFWPEEMGFARYDFLFLAALGIQLLMLAFKLETIAEAKVILIFHIVGTLMEIFKTSVGSWIYPEPSFFRIGGVPLFSGFMYAAVGSYLARVTRILDLHYTDYPPRPATVLLALAIYANFFTHHFVIDLRYLLFVITILFWRTTVHYRVFRFRHRMPLLVGFLLIALFIWYAENIGTWSRAWIYPSQHAGWTPVSLQKLGAWYLLMILSFVLVTLVHRPRPLQAMRQPRPANDPPTATPDGIIVGEASQVSR
ncbi:DUF817 domain-containing protein [Ensifer canadensis]